MNKEAGPFGTLANSCHMQNLRVSFPLVIKHILSACKPPLLHPMNGEKLSCILFVSVALGSCLCMALRGTI